jgi:hypothetical protein
MSQHGVNLFVNLNVVADARPGMLDFVTLNAKGNSPRISMEPPNDLPRD